MCPGHQQKTKKTDPDQGKHQKPMFRQQVKHSRPIPCQAADLLTAGDVQDLGQLSEISRYFFQQQFQAVADNVDLLLGLQAVAALRVDQQLQGHVLKGSHFQLGVQQLLADLLWRLTAMNYKHGKNNHLDSIFADTRIPSGFCGARGECHCPGWGQSEPPRSACGRCFPARAAGRGSSRGNPFDQKGIKLKKEEKDPLTPRTSYLPFSSKLYLTLHEGFL